MSIKKIIDDQTKVLQAVAFVELFDDRFGPITHSMPKV